MLLNKTDLEILWTLKSLSRNLTKSEIVSNNDRLTFNDKFRLRLLFLKDHDFVEMESIQDYGVHYRINKKSLDLLWSDNPRHNLLNLIQIADFTLEEIMHFIDDSVEDINLELNLLKNCDSPMIEYVMMGEEERFHLTSNGIKLIKNHVLENSS